MDVIRFGLHGALRKIHQDFSRATPRSTGARAAGSSSAAERDGSSSIPSGFGRALTSQSESKVYI